MPKEFREPTQTVSVYFSGEDQGLLDKIDKERGDVKRSTFIIKKLREVI